jgi:hypothetical protein
MINSSKCEHDEQHHLLGLVDGMTTTTTTKLGGGNPHHAYHLFLMNP